MGTKQEPEDEKVTGLDISCPDLAGQVADALVYGGAVQEDDRSKCQEIATEEIWIRKLLRDGTPRGNL